MEREMECRGGVRMFRELYIGMQERRKSRRSVNGLSHRPVADTT